MLHQNFIGSLRKAARVTDGRKCGFCDDDVWMIPRFTLKAGVPWSSALDYFAVYSLRSAYRGVLTGANYLGAGGVVFEREMNAPAISMFYSAAYHAAGALASLSGRVWFDLTHDTQTVQEIGRDVIVACLTKDNRWVLEGVKNRNHQSWWMQLRAPLRDLDRPAPPYFQELLDHYSVGIYKSGPSLHDVLKALVEGRPDPRQRYKLHERVDWLLHELAETRHIAHYSGLGVDPSYVDALTNGEVGGGQDHLRAQAIGNFAANALLHAGAMILQVREAVQLPEELEKALILGVHSPWFDKPSLEQVESYEMRHVVERLLEQVRLGRLKTT